MGGNIDLPFRQLDIRMLLPTCSFKNWLHINVLIHGIYQLCHAGLEYIAPLVITGTTDSLLHN